MVLKGGVLENKKYMKYKNWSFFNLERIIKRVGGT
jgi:hypothetical protein